MKHLIPLISLVLFIVISSCSPSDGGSSSSQNDDTFAQNFGNAVARDFIGQVVDGDNHPVQNATITIGTSTVQTDINGVFVINGASVHEKFAYITAKKTGFIEGSRAMVPTTGKNNVRIMLLPNTPLETIQAGTTSEVSIYTGTKVVFDGAFQDETGNAYSGAVAVSMFHLTPSDENISQLMPGMLYAQTSENKEAVLQTFGMLNVELRGSAGQKLNIAEGHTAEITLRIDDAQQATAPSTIPLWHFDETKGYWKEDGTATKVGNKYVGEVSHFSWWNLDSPIPKAMLTLTFVTADGTPLSNLQVGIVSDIYNYPIYGLTNENGVITGYVPSNQSIGVVVNGPCGPIYSATIGVISVDTVQPNIVIANTFYATTHVKGNLKKCNNSPVTNGYVILQNQNSFDPQIVPVVDGVYDFVKYFCTNNNSYSIKGVDAQDAQLSQTVAVTLVPAGITNVALLKTCTPIMDFVSIKVDNNQTYYVTDNVLTQANNDQILIQGFNWTSPTTDVIINLKEMIPGTYTTADSPSINGYYVGNSSISPPANIGNSVQNTLQFKLFNIGAVGEYIDMEISGTFYDGSNVQHTLYSVVHSLRDQ